ALRPERSQSMQASVTWQASSASWLSAGIFANRVRDLIATGSQERDGEGTLQIVYDNVERARTYGAEAAARWRVSGGWSLGLDYTWLEAVDESRQRALAGRARHSGAAQVRFEDRAVGFSAAVVAALMGRRPFYVDTGDSEVTRWSPTRRAVS